jgi:hypothetical protein
LIQPTTSGISQCILEYSLVTYNGSLTEGISDTTRTVDGNITDNPYGIPSSSSVLVESVRTTIPSKCETIFFKKDSCCGTCVFQALETSGEKSVAGTDYNIYAQLGQQ